MDQSRDHAENFAEALEASLNFNQPQQGDVLKGSIVSISGDDAYVAFGGPTEAVIAVSELEEGVDVGDEVEATVIQTGAMVRLSRQMLIRQATAEALRGAFENRLAVEGKVSGRNKGGFDVNVNGNRAFCPLSQIALGKIEDPDSFVGKTFEFRITEYSENGRKFVVSRAQLMKEEAAARADEVRERLEIGAELTGRIKNIVPFGAFVDLGGLEGLVHVSELSRRRVNDPNEVVTAGQEVTVKVIKIENNGKRISLSMKDLEPDPWESVAERFVPGEPFTGTVARSTEFGFFVELEPGIDGLVHVSQLPLGMKMDDPSVAAGSVIRGWIREVDADRRRISLAMREVAVNDPWENIESRYHYGKVIEGTVERAGGPGVFVELEPGLTGLIPNSELSIPPGSDASRVHQPGQKLSVKILSLDTNRRRISLSHEAAKDEASHRDYQKYVQETRAAEQSASGGGALALALRRALGSEVEQ
ncbi:MAG: S1 RNA-binding domain-containing protein [Thermoanaerobaculia bacterium]